MNWQRPRENEEEWFAAADENAALAGGLVPEDNQCIEFSVPLVFAFAESGSPNTPYVADLYEHVSFLGDVNRQVAELPDGKSASRD